MSKAKTRNQKSSARSPLYKNLSVAFLLAGLIAGAAAYWGYQRFVVEAETARLNELSQAAAQEQAGVVADYLRELRAKLQRFARRDIGAQALAEGNTGHLERFQADLRNALPDARAIALFQGGEADLNPDGDPPIRFAELDMINRAEKRQTVLPEASQADGEWRITFVEPLPFAEAAQGENGDAPPPVVGTLFVSYSAGEVSSVLGATDLSKGRTVLMQQFSRADPQPIFQFGEGNAGASRDAHVAGSYWFVRFTPAAGFAQQATVSLLPYIGGVALLAAVLFGAAYAIALKLSQGQVEAAGRAGAARAGRAKAASATLDDVDVAAEDASLLGLNQAEEDPLDIRDKPQDIRDKSEPAPAAPQAEIPLSIFRAYDIRGRVADQLRPEWVVLIGQAIGSQVIEAGDNAVVVGRDGRNHSPDVSEQLIEGILSTGCNVINIGMAPTPLVYFATCELPTTNSGVMVTASHNPGEENGFKIVIRGKTLLGDQIKALHARITQRRFLSGSGNEDFTDLSLPYMERILSDVALAGELSVVLDCGNGVAGDLAPRLFDELGCKVTPLFCKVDGNFPNHPPDPSVPANLKSLIEKVKEVQADLGIALDGDGDRVGVVTASGRILWPDRLLMLLAKDIVARNPGADVIFDVKSSRELNSVVTSYGGRPIMWKSGHSNMKQKMQETDALLGGELSGHIFIKERWFGFDDGMYAAARIMEIMSLREQDLDSIFESFPDLPATPELKIPVEEGRQFELVQKLTKRGDFGEGKLTTIDGLRVDYPDGWGLVRASNTSAALTLRFEGQSRESMARIQELFMQQLLAVDNTLTIPF